MPYQPTELALEAYNMWVSGITDVKSIAFELDRSEQWVRENLKQQGIELEKGRRGLFEELGDADKEDIVERYNRGEPVNAICHLYHMSSGGFYGLLRKMGISPRRVARDSIEGRKIQEELALRMYIEGWVVWYITDETGLYPPDILKLARRAGVPMRGRGHRGKVPMKDPEGNIVFESDATTPKEGPAPKMFDDKKDKE